MESSSYSFIYTSSAKELRRGLSLKLRNTLYEIEDGLTEDPNQFLNRTISVTDEVKIYRHPEPKLELTYKIDPERKIIIFAHIVAPLFEVTAPLFISYSHKDNEWLIELKECLKPLEQENLIKIWDDTRIKAGDNWRNEIKKALNTAKAAVLLISPDFLSSSFIKNNELPHLLDSAKEMGVKIFWIAIKPSDVEKSEIEKYQALHKEPPLIKLKPKDRRREYDKIYRRIKEAINYN